jgi:hypothetical protein
MTENECFQVSAYAVPTRPQRHHDMKVYCRGSLGRREISYHEKMICSFRVESAWFGVSLWKVRKYLS